MISNPPTITVPLQTDKDDVIRVSGTRVTLDVVIARFQDGATPDDIHESFDILPINDIYAVIAYYLTHRDELDAYIQRREEEGERMRHEWEAKYPPTITRTELERRLAARKEDQDQ
ncbi:MAG: DUF433 domain-containing protein [Chloroflexota bacterium]